MYNENIFETAARIIPELQKVNWQEGPYGGYDADKPLDITTLVKSADEAALASQVVTRVLNEAPYFPKGPGLLVKLEHPAADGKLLLSLSLPDDSQIEAFKADNSLIAQHTSQPRVSAAAPANLKETIQHVREESAKEWTRTPEGDYWQELQTSHGSSGTRLIYNEFNAQQISAMLEANPDYKALPEGERPRLEIEPSQNGQPTVLTVRKKDAKPVLVDLLGLDGKKLGIPSVPSKG